MKTIRGVGRFMAKQVLAILIACCVVVGTVIAMFLAALVVALFGFFGATFFLLSPILGIVMREKMKGWSSALDHFNDQLKEFTTSANAASAAHTRDPKVTPIRRKDS